ncbi:MAG: glycosyltransferase family 39 protein, partial [Planctomycetia bacterium]|nr:glycosyltransferase family 39 protein [Planctomycetia bacterium]
MTHRLAQFRTWLARRRALLALALLYTTLNAVKPLTVDDTAYYFFARQCAEQPERPYDFQVFWYQVPEPANTVLAPPVLPYWWSLALRLFGERPWLWKLWLLPFAILLVFSLDNLARCFAPGMRQPLVWLTVLSPSFLPSFNLMLDVPAVALSLTALALFMRAVGRQSWLLALWAGVCAGLAMQTKYTAFMVPAVMLLYLACFARKVNRVAIGLSAVMLAIVLFVQWEQFIAGQYGKSHFTANRPTFPGWDDWLNDKLRLLKALLPLLGGLAPALTLLGMLAVGMPRWALGLVAAGIAIGFGIIAGFEIESLRFGNGFWLERPLEQAVFLIGGLLFAAVLTLVCWDLWFAARDAPCSFSRRVSVFLMLWLLGELAAFFLLSTFPAARRVMGLVLVATLVVGRLASHFDLYRLEKRLVRTIVGGGIALGLLFYTVDLCDALAGQQAAESAAHWIAAQPADAA